jgi:hypothetical protein
MENTLSHDEVMVPIIDCFLRVMNVAGYYCMNQAASDRVLPLCMIRGVKPNMLSLGNETGVVLWNV